MLLSQRGDGRGKHGAQLQPRAVNSRSHRIDRQFTGGGNLFPGEPADFAEEKNVSIEVGQRRQRLFQRQRHLLLGVFRGLRRRAQVCLGPAAALPVMVDRHVPGDLEQPPGQLVLGLGMAVRLTLRNTSWVQIASGLAFARDTAEIPDQAVGSCAKSDSASVAEVTGVICRNDRQGRSSREESRRCRAGGRLRGGRSIPQARREAGRTLPGVCGRSTLHIGGAPNKRLYSRLKSDGSS